MSGIAIGPLDLSLSMGTTRESDEFQRTVDDLLETGNEVDCGVGTFVSGPDEIERYRDRASFVMCGFDIGVLVSVFSSL